MRVERKASIQRLTGEQVVSTRSICDLRLPSREETVSLWNRAISLLSSLSLFLSLSLLARRYTISPPPPPPPLHAHTTAEQDRRVETLRKELTDVEERLRDPRTNILTGARMLADLQRRFGRIDTALAAWNAGEGRVRRAGNRLPRIAETEAHVEMVLELYWALLQREQAQRAHSIRVTPSR